MFGIVFGTLCLIGLILVTVVAFDQFAKSRRLK